MKLSRKLQKLLSTDFFASAFEHLSRGTHPVNKRRILETLDRAQFEKLREQYPYRPGSPRINRFEDVVYWIEINIERAQDLWLERQSPLPDLGAKFDLVTAHRICFHRIGRVRDGIEWSPADWEVFINDIRTRFLNENGRLLLDFNPRPDGSSFFTPELREFFLSQGARIFRSKALLGVRPNQRPRFKQTR